MPTPGPWQGPVQRTAVPGSIQTAGYWRWGRDLRETHHAGVNDPTGVNGLINGLRVGTNGGTSGLSPNTELLSSRCFARAEYELAIDGTFLDVADARDYGWFFACNLMAGWSAYTAAIDAEVFTEGAEGYEVEGGNFMHFISVDGAHVNIPMELTALNYPAVSMKSYITTAPGSDPGTIGTALEWEIRNFLTGYTVESSGGTTSEYPITLNLEPGHFDSGEGGFHLYSRSEQGTGAWDTGGYAGRDEVRPEIWFHSAFAGGSSINYDVTFPRYRLLFGVPVVEPVVSVTRQFPRDDALGSMGSASRLVPAPRGGRVVGGYQ